MVLGVDAEGGAEGGAAGGKRKRGRPPLNGAKSSREPVAYLKDAGKCKACDGMHRTHTCGKVCHLAHIHAMSHHHTTSYMLCHIIMPHTCGKVGQVRVVERNSL